MEVGSLFFLLAIIVVVLIVITQPFYRPEKAQAARAVISQKGDEEDPEYLAIVRNIRELTADYEMGKINQADYNSQRSLLEDQALKKFSQIELRGSKSASTQEQGSEFEEMIHSRRMNRTEPTSGFCSRCGKPVQKSDQFCPSCGEPTRLYL